MKQEIQSVPLSQQELLNRITNRIRQSLELQSILDTTADEVRQFLDTDRVKIYQFQPDGHGLVIAESLNADQLPSLLGLHFPADDIPLYAREMFLRVRQRVIADLANGQIGVSPIREISGDKLVYSTGIPADNIAYRPIDPCHVEYLRSMGVQSSVVVPIVIEGVEGVPLKRPNPSITPLPSLPPSSHLWGLLVSHHANPHQVAAEELSFIQAVVDQLAIAITHSILMQHSHEEAQQKSDVAKIIGLLHDENLVNLQAALDETVKLFKGSGGRLYLPQQHFLSPLTPLPEPTPQIYTDGAQPDQLSPDETRPIEENLLWQRFLTSIIPAQSSTSIPSQSAPSSSQDKTTEPSENQPSAQKNVTAAQADPEPMLQLWSVPWMRAVYALSQVPSSQTDYQQAWAIPDIYQEPLFRSLVSAFQATDIRGLLILPFYLEQGMIGCLTIFRDGVDQELVWAGKFNPDKRQLAPRQSFEAWRQIKEGQVQPWSDGEVRLGQAIAERFAAAVKQHRLYEEVTLLNAKLGEEVQARTKELRRTEVIARQQQAIATIMAALQTSSDVTSIFRTAIQEVRQVLQLDRVNVYRFDSLGSEDVIEVFSSVAPPWASTDAAIRNIWQTQDDGSDQHGRVGDLTHNSKVVNDIYAAQLAPKHIDDLEQQHIRAFIAVPILVGQHLWGLFCLYQEHAPREWTQAEVNFVTQIAAYLGSALQQAELFALTQQQADKVPLMLGQQQTVAGVIGKIRQSLDLSTIFSTTTKEVRRLLKTDRVSIFKFDPGSSWNLGSVIAEDRNLSYIAAQSVTVEDHCFGERYAHQYELHRIFAVDDIYEANLDPCYIETLAQFQVWANLVVPLRNQFGLWGLLCIHQCSGPHQWQDWEIKFAEQIATHLSVALQQAELFQQASAAKQAADAANRAKSEFLATMSHELRTPLNAILGFSESLQDEIFGELTEAQGEAIATIEQSGNHLLALITDILDLAKIESGELVMAPVTIDFAEVCAACLQFIRPLARRKQIELISEVEPHNDPITVDPLRVRQLLINLLNNAVKFTPKGGQVTLRTWVHSDRHTVEFHIVDTGIGIAPDDIPKIFQSFVQLDSRLNRQYEGTGLGLALVKQLVDAQQGTIEVDSVLDQGSCFRVTLPYQPVSSEPEPASSESKPASSESKPASSESKPASSESKPASSEPKLVSPEPKPISPESKPVSPKPKPISPEPKPISSEPKPVSSEPKPVSSEPKPVSSEPKSVSSEPKSVSSELKPISSELKPVSSEPKPVSSESKPISPESKPISPEPILPESKPISSESKPILSKPEFILSEPEFILSELEASVPNPGETVSTPAPLPTTAVPSKKPDPEQGWLILLAEDNESNVDTFSTYLAHYKHRVIVAYDGQEAIALTQAHHPDIILMDIHMPVMDGIEAIRQIRQLPDFSTIPIIALTALAMPGDQDRCIEAGANHYLAKPVKLKQLGQLINDLLTADKD